MRTTNAQERFNVEIRRRTSVVRIFPNEVSASRLITTLAMEISEDRGDGRYLDISLLEECAPLGEEMASAVWKMTEDIQLGGAGAAPKGRGQQHN